jgi:hypothetical protein
MEGPRNSQPTNLAIWVRCLEREHHLPGAVDCKALVGKGGPGVPIEVFELMTLVDGEAHLGMQAEALRVDTAFLCGRRHAVRDGLQGQYVLPGARPECDAVGTAAACRGVRVLSGSGSAR